MSARTHRQANTHTNKDMHTGTHYHSLKDGLPLNGFSIIEFGWDRRPISVQTLMALDASWAYKHTAVKAKATEQNIERKQILKTATEIQKNIQKDSEHRFNFLVLNTQRETGNDRIKFTSKIYSKLSRPLVILHKKYQPYVLFVWSDWRDLHWGELVI